MKTCPGLPLVMHGSSSVPQEFIDLVNKYGGAMPNAKGVPEDQIAMAVQKYGVCKVNIDTDLRLAMTAKIREVFATKPAEFDPRNYLGPAREAITQMVQRKLHVLNSAGKAEVIVAHWEKLGKPMPRVLHQEPGSLNVSPRSPRRSPGSGLQCMAWTCSTRRYSHIDWRGRISPPGRGVLSAACPPTSSWVRCTAGVIWLPPNNDWAIF